MDKRITMLGAVVGSIIGGYIPTLFGEGMFSFASLFGSLVGAILGLWLAFKLLR